MPSSEISRFLNAEVAADAARREIAGRESARHRGVCWSGLDPTPSPPRSMETLQARANVKMAARQAWRASPDGAFLTAMVDCQAAARDAFTTAERARAGSARGEPAEWRRQVLDDLLRQARRLDDALRQARNAAGAA